MEGPTERGDKAEEQDEEEDKDKDSHSSNDSSSSSREQSKDEQPTKPPTRSKGAMKRKPNVDPDKGKEGTADDIPIPCKMEVHCKECKPRGRPTLRAGAESCTNCSASKLARAAGDFGAPQNRERQAHYAAACKLLVTRMFLSLGLSDEIVDAIMDEQGYNTPHALNCFDKKGEEQLISVILKPGGMKDGTHNLGINVPL